MLAYTAQMRRLRHVYQMLANLEKEDIEPNLTVHNLLRDIERLVFKLVEKTAI